MNITFELRKQSSESVEVLKSEVFKSEVRKVSRHIKHGSALYLYMRSPHTLLKIHQFADGKRLIFRQPDSLVLRLPIWLMEFLMESTSYCFTV